MNAASHKSLMIKYSTLKGHNIDSDFRLLMKCRQKKVKTSSFSSFATSYWFISDDSFSINAPSKDKLHVQFETRNTASFELRAEFP